MLPQSDEIEALHGRVKRMSAELKKLGNTEITKADVKADLASIAREWLRMSAALRDSGVCRADRLDLYEQKMRDLLSSTTGRTRASTANAKLTDFAKSAFDDIVVPLIKLQGSPRQVAARQIQSSFPNNLSPDEKLYVEEAARCVTVQCFRAALIMLWAAAVARVHAAIIRRGFDNYNKAVDAILTKKGHPYNKVKDGAKLSSLPELQRSRDADLLVVGMELFGFDLQIYQELERLLGVRNDAAHPGMAQPGALDVQQYASKLSTSIFERIVP